MKVNLENKKVLLTGASGGIGKALSEKFIINAKLNIAKCGAMENHKKF